MLVGEWKKPFHVGTLAAACAEANDFAAAVKWQTRANELYSTPRTEKKGTRLKLYHENKPYRETHQLVRDGGRRVAAFARTRVSPGVATTYAFEHTLF